MITSTELAAALRDPSRLEPLVERYGEEHVARLADHECVAGCLAFHRSDRPWLAERRRLAMLQEAVRERAEAEVFEALRARGIRGAVFKGAALARSHYPAPWCRVRLDLDLLVARDDRHRAADALAGLGYVGSGRVSGQLINHQDVFERRLASGVIHPVDLHWEVSNRALFVSCLPARELLARSVPAPWAGDTIRMLHPVDSLLLSCVHRAAHHTDRTFLIWSYDVWLLARAFGGDEAAEFSRRARTLGLASLCAHELADAARLLGGDGPALSPPFIAELRIDGERELARRFLKPGRTELGDLALDLRALPRWRDRARLLREHLFPAASFVAAAHGNGSTARNPLGWLYVRRMVFGGLRWIRHAVGRE